LHQDIRYHPECPERIDHCLDKIRSLFDDEDDVSNRSAVRVIDVACTKSHKLSDPLTDAEISHAEFILSKIHDPEYIASLKSKCEQSRQNRIDVGDDPLGWIGYIDGSDTYLTTESYNVGLRTTCAWIKSVETSLWMSTCAENTLGDQIGISLTRPPGHHAMHSEANGFCYFNFAMAAAFHALQIQPGIKISIVDFDVHFGQGIADILEKCNSNMKENIDGDWTSNIRYVSLHQVPGFPYLGQSRKKQGRNQNILTIPIHVESTWSCGYRELFTKYALPFVSTPGKWEPNLVIVCAGYDALDSEELASVNLVANDFGEMTRILKDHIHQSTSKKSALMFGLEGGYQLREGVAGGNLSDALISTIRALRQ
jgi:acetoin utilization deacetylase AcuC-like enzyme